VAFGPETKDATTLPAALLMVLLGLGARLEHQDGSRAVTEIRSPAQLAHALPGAIGGQGVWLHVPREVLATVTGVRPFGPQLAALERPLEIRAGCVRLLGGVVHHAFATGVEGLFVAGALATGCHGADLLLGVNTSFTLYSAENAATAAATYWSRTRSAHLAEHAVWAEEERLASRLSRPKRIDESRRAELAGEIRRVMWEHAGPHRTGAGLNEAASRFRGLQQELAAVGVDTGAELVALCELDALVRTGALTCQAALAREETRGQHARADFPSADDARGRHWISVSGRSDRLVWKRLPVPG
jgi:succinate dehydrogenase/fumarate reductase flavoprotein subunit